MIKIKITTEEKTLLKEYLRTTPLPSVRLKCAALLMRDKEMKIEAIADIVSRDRKTVSRWVKEWDRQHMAGIFSGHENNTNAGKLTKEQKEEIKKALAKPPSAYGIPKEFWDVPALKKYVKAKFEVVYESDRSYHFLLAFSNLSFKYPDTFDFRRDEKAINKRMAEIKREIEQLLKEDDWEIFVADEVRMELEAFTRRAWLKKGKRTMVKVDRKKESQSYIGFLNQINFKCHLFEMPWQNQEEVLKVFDMFLKEYPKKKICVIWDNAPFHKGKEIKKALGKGHLLERVHLINMPPYAPDKNPIEHVWNTVKGKMANIQYDDFEETKEVFMKNIDGEKFKYQM